MSQNRETEPFELLDMGDCQPKLDREIQERLTVINRRLMRLVAPHSRFGPGLSLVPWSIKDSLRFLERVSIRVSGSTRQIDIVTRMMSVFLDNSTQRYEPRREFRFNDDDLRVLRWLVVKLLYPIGRSESDGRAKISIKRIADELNVSTRTVNRIVKDKSRSFEPVFRDRPDLAKIAAEIYRSIVKPSLVINRGEIGPDDRESIAVVEPLKLTRGERPNFPKSPERRHAHAVLILRSSIASAARIRPDELTLEAANRVLGESAPAAETLDELLESLANRDSGRIRESSTKTEPIGYIGFKVIHQAKLAEIDARLEAEALRLDGNETERYVQIHTKPKSLSREDVREIARKTDDEIAELACEFGPNCEVARLLGIEANETNDFIELHNRLDPRDRLGSVIADLFNVSRRLRLHLRIVEKENRSRPAKRRTARARRRGDRLREES